MNTILIEIFTWEEVKLALKQMAFLKSTRSDDTLWVMS